jgi:hypothetical protein
MDHYPDRYPAQQRRRSIGWLIPVLVLVIIAAGWSAFWFYAADRARDTIAGWIEREARGGRIYTCGSQSLGGFPFRIEFRCNQATAEFEKTRPPVKLSAGNILAAVQVYQPTLVLAEIDGPMTVADPGQPPKMTANWSLAQVSLRGTPRNPQRVSFAADKLTLDRNGADKPERVLAADKGQLHGRLASGTVGDNPVIDVAASLKGATALSWHPLAAKPFDFDGDTRLVGLRNFQPKSWTERFKEIQQSNGRIEVRNARLRQGDLLAVATGNLKLTKQGYLDGELTVTASGVAAGRQPQPEARRGVEPARPDGAGCDLERGIAAGRTGRTGRAPCHKDAAALQGWICHAGSGETRADPVAVLIDGHCAVL